MSERKPAAGKGHAASPDPGARQAYDATNLELASRIHYSMIPKGFQNGLVDIDVKAIPCHAIGGDYCSVIPRGDGRLNINICDVMGHGIASAVLAARINSYILSRAMHMNHPCEIGKISVSPGDRIVLYTDGVLDVENPEKVVFGVEGIERMVREHPDLSAGEWNSRLEDELFGPFEGSPTDDILVLTTKILGLPG
jgi:serine phosphatase RsbU (regulator of sigma subunit)